MKTFNAYEESVFSGAENILLSKKRSKVSEKILR
jgi:hypothetical protein